MIRRDMYMKKIRPFIGTDLVKVMTGIRRCGKSVMLDLIKEELKENGVSEANFISFNFEDMRNSHLCTAEALHEEVQRRIDEIEGKSYLFFDEIQEVAQWEKCINSFRVEFDCDIYITGSNAKLLSGELVTVLGGRYVEFTIYPFSFSEFKELYSSVFPEASDVEMFQKYLILGGMPYLGNLRYMEEPGKQYLKDIYNSVVLTDESLKKTGMTSYRYHSPNKLSGGQKQRVAIAGVMAMRPKCIILDEPTAMLDPNGRKEVLEAVSDLNRQEGVTVILITHYMEEVVHADKVYVMDNGEVVMQGTPKEIFSQVETLKEYRLDVPQVTLLAHELHKAGVDIPEGILTTEELVNALCL